MPKDAWQRLSAGEGTEGARPHDWIYLDLADLDVGDFDARFPGIWTRGLHLLQSFTRAISMR